MGGREQVRSFCIMFFPLRIGSRSGDTCDLTCFKLCYNQSGHFALEIELGASASTPPTSHLLRRPPHDRNEPLVIFGLTTHEQEYVHVYMWKGPLSESQILAFAK